MLTPSRSDRRRAAPTAAALPADLAHEDLDANASGSVTDQDAPTPESPWRRALLFARNFLRHPLAVGTLFESSPALVRRLATTADWRQARRVVELGPGVGTVTRALLPLLPRDARLLAVETNPQFVRELRRGMRDGRLEVVQGSAVQLASHLQAHGIAQVDAIISGIPFSTLPRAARAGVLDAAADALRPDGELVIYQHSRLVEPLLRARFADVRSGVEWRNPVPMRIFHCRQPLPRPARAS